LEAVLRPRRRPGLVEEVRKLGREVRQLREEMAHIREYADRLAGQGRRAGG
jgi:hypothetical protein